MVQNNRQFCKFRMSAIPGVENARHCRLFSTSKFDNLHTIRCEIVWQHWILHQIWELTTQQGYINGVSRTPRTSQLSECRSWELCKNEKILSPPKKIIVLPKDTHLQRCQLIWSVFRISPSVIDCETVDRNLSYDQLNTCSFHVVTELSLQNHLLFVSN